MRYRLPQSEWPLFKNLQTVNAGEGMGKREPSYVFGGNVSWYSHYREQCGHKWPQTLNTAARPAALLLRELDLLAAASVARGTLSQSFIACISGPVVKDQSRCIWLLRPRSWVCSVILLCPALCDAMNCSPPGSSVPGILQARILERVATPSSRGSSQPRDWTCVSYISCLGRQVLYH